MSPIRCERREFGRVYVQRQMRGYVVVIGGIGLKHPTQVRFVEHHQVVEPFPQDRADEALDVAVLPSR